MKRKHEPDRDTSHIVRIYNNNNNNNHLRSKNKKRKLVRRVLTVEQEPPLLHLPDDCLFCILSFLSGNELIHSLSLTHTSIRGLILSPILWATRTYGQYTAVTVKGVSCPPAAYRDVCQFAHLRVSSGTILDISNILLGMKGYVKYLELTREGDLNLLHFQITSELLERYGSVWDSIEHFVSEIELQERFMGSILALVPKLRTFLVRAMFSSPFHPQSYPLSPLPYSITTFSVGKSKDSGRSVWKDELLGNFLSKAQSLRYFRLETEFSRNILSTILSNISSTSLEELILNIYGNISSVKYVRPLPSLTKLSLTVPSLSPSAVKLILSQCTSQLRSLTLKTTEYLGDSISDIQGISALSGLTSLDLLLEDVGRFVKYFLPEKKNRLLRLTMNDVYRGWDLFPYSMERETFYPNIRVLTLKRVDIGSASEFFSTLFSQLQFLKTLTVQEPVWSENGDICTAYSNSLEGLVLNFSGGGSINISDGLFSSLLAHCPSLAYIEYVTEEMDWQKFVIITRAVLPRLDTILFDAYIPHEYDQEQQSHENGQSLHVLPTHVRRVTLISRCDMKFWTFYAFSYLIRFAVASSFCQSFEFVADWAQHFLPTSCMAPSRVMKMIDLALLHDIECGDEERMKLVEKLDFGTAAHSVESFDDYIINDCTTPVGEVLRACSFGYSTT